VLLSLLQIHTYETILTKVTAVYQQLFNRSKLKLIIRLSKKNDSSSQILFTCNKLENCLLYKNHFQTEILNVGVVLEQQSTKFFCLLWHIPIFYYVTFVFYVHFAKLLIFLWHILISNCVTYFFMYILIFYSFFFWAHFDILLCNLLFCSIAALLTLAFGFCLRDGMSECSRSKPDWK
jgi:hypothetical protein